MAVYYKFKSAKDYDSLAIDGYFISVANLKEQIFEKKHMQRGTDFDLIVTNAQTNQEYLDQDMIPKNTSVLIRRVPGLPCRPIVILPDKSKVETLVQNDQPAKSSITAADSSGLFDLDASELDYEFGNSLYAPTIPEMLPGQVRKPVKDPVPQSKADEDNKIKALVENSGFDMQYRHNGFGPGKGARGGRDFGCSGLGFRTPRQNYVCHRCNVPGHFIQHCPTNGDSNYDIKKVRPHTLDVLKADENAFDKEMESLSSSRSLGNLPPELRCPLCTDVMKNAVLSSKCCFESFCDKCIRDYIISKSMCVCGVRDVRADDLLPNKTVRDTIDRFLGSGNSSADNTGGSVHQVHDMESVRNSQPTNLSPTLSAALEGEQMLTLDAKETPKLKEKMDGSEVCDAPPPLVLLNSSDEKIAKVPDVSEATHEAVTLKEPALQSSSQLVVEKVQQKVAAIETGNKKKKKKVVPAYVNAADMQWMGTHHDMNGYMGHSAFNPCWPVNEMMGSFGCNMPPYNTVYGIGTMDMPFVHYIPPVPFGAQEFMIPQTLSPPQRDPPKVHDYDRQTNDYGREASSNGNGYGYVSPVKSKPMPAGRTPTRRSPSEGRYHNQYHEPRLHVNGKRKRENVCL